jgi:tetratricopeptide (TPR) repeat protein
MRAGHFACGALLGLLLLPGCATSYVEGRQALSRGNYVDAAQRFEQVLTEEPGRLDARIGLGIGRYKQGALGPAIEALEQAVGRAPDNPEARLYLGLSYLRRGDASRAEREFTALRDLPLDPRFATLLDGAIAILRTEPSTEAVRSFMAGSLESEAELLHHLGEAILEAQRARAYVASPPCTLVRRHGQLFCL